VKREKKGDKKEEERKGRKAGGEKKEKTRSGEQDPGESWLRADSLSIRLSFRRKGRRGGGGDGEKAEKKKGRIHHAPMQALPLRCGPDRFLPLKGEGKGERGGKKRERGEEGEGLGRRE